MSEAVSKGAVRLEAVSIAYQAERVVHGVSLDIAPGEFICLLGPSGCGKTTTLRAIAGLTPIESGTLSIDGEVANGKPAHRRGIGMVFQDLALFPHMTVYRNVLFGLELRGVESTEADRRVRDILSLLHLDGFERRLPRQLSGGQQQRVALARSLVVNPSVLLLDEPFAALDRKLREDMRREIRALQRQLGITAVFVTHDQEEALTMADRVVVMNMGVIEQAGTPDDVYEAPVNRFVLGFVGDSNVLRVHNVSEAGDGVRGEIAGTVCELRGRRMGSAGRGVTEVAVRPERIQIASSGMAEAVGNTLEGTLRNVSYEGAMRTYDVVLRDGQSLLVREQNQQRHGAPAPQVGGKVLVIWHPADAMLLV